MLSEIIGDDNELINIKEIDMELLKNLSRIMELGLK